MAQSLRKDQRTGTLIDRLKLIEFERQKERREHEDGRERKRKKVTQREAREIGLQRYRERDRGRERGRKSEREKKKDSVVLLTPDSVNTRIPSLYQAATDGVVCT